MLPIARSATGLIAHSLLDHAMSHHVNPFDDILQPQPRPARGPAFQDDPFGDDDSPVLFEQNGRNINGGSNGAYGGGGSSRGPNVSSSRDVGHPQGYTLDPFFDESVGRS